MKNGKASSRQAGGTDRVETAHRLAVFRAATGDRTAGPVADQLAESRRNRTRQLCGCDDEEDAELNAIADTRRDEPVIDVTLDQSPRECDQPIR